MFWKASKNTSNKKPYKLNPAPKRDFYFALKPPSHFCFTKKLSTKIDTNKP